jgi:hypothetical protein
LEKRLDEIDESEKAPIFLGKARMDRNSDRLTILSDIETSLDEFGMSRLLSLCQILTSSQMTL